MRPFIQGHSYIKKHLYLRNGRYYFRLDIPTDIAHYFPTSEVKRSLKTSDPVAAKLVALGLELKVQQVCALLRLGMLSDDMIKHLVDSVLPYRRKATAPESTGKLLTSVIETYTAEKKSNWTSKTKLEVSGVFKLLVGILGDVDVSSITRPMLIDLRSSLLKVPPNFYVKNPGCSVRKAIADSTVPGLSIKTVNKHVARIGSLLKYCHEQGVIINNPATGLQLSDKQRADQERSAYSIKDIERIVANLPTDAATPERYWIPLIGIFQGMRLNEICQLHIEDVVNIEGHWCFDINCLGNKRLKNTPSERVIPVHPKLIELGFMEYVKSLKVSGHPRLWMNLSYIEMHGYTNSIGKWYMRFNREFVSEDPKKVFHSMRHTVADTLKQKGLADSLISEIIGHAHSCISTSRYGKQYKPAIMLEAMTHLDYGVSIPKW